MFGHFAPQHRYLWAIQELRQVILNNCNVPLRSGGRKQNFNETTDICRWHQPFNTIVGYHPA